MDPLVSIIIPTHNREHLIGETLDSVLAQTFLNWECIVVDDGSNDNTREFVLSYCKKEPRIKFYHRPASSKNGASACRNFGLEKSKGRFVQFLDSDDIISKEKLEAQVEMLEVNPLISLATCKWGRFKQDLNDAEIYQDFQSYNHFDNPLHLIDSLANSLGFFPIHAYLIRKSIIAKAGYWNEYLSLNDDAEFMLRVISNSDRIFFVSKAVALYRLPEENNLSSYTDESKVIDAINSWKLIEAYLRIRFKKEEFYFLEKAINEFYYHAKVFPEVIKNNKDFFRVQLRRDSSRIQKYFFRKKGK